MSARFGATGGVLEGGALDGDGLEGEAPDGVAVDVDPVAGTGVSVGAGADDDGVAAGPVVGAVDCAHAGAANAATIAKHTAEAKRIAQTLPRRGLACIHRTIDVANRLHGLRGRCYRLAS
jgi:hypothetical protein